MCVCAHDAKETTIELSVLLPAQAAIAKEMAFVQCDAKRW